MTYTLITANRNYSSWSLRPWVLMKALGIAFEDELEPFTMPVNYDAFRSFSPTGQVPVLIDAERTQWDSLGIVLYLADRHPQVWPQDPDARAFAQSAVCEMHAGFPALRSTCTMNVGLRVRLNPMSGDLVREVHRLREMFEEGLARFGGPWLAGPQFSAMDAFYAPVAFRVCTYGLDVGGGQAWVDAMLAHPAMRQWEQEARAETWREAGHEAEVRIAGEIIADHRVPA